MGKLQMRRGETSNHRVIITTYVESTKRHPHPERERIKPKPCRNKPQSGKTHGCDRKAQLLAYVKELRSSNSQHLDRPTTYSSSSKSKKRRWIRIASPAKLSHSICRLFDRNLKEPWRYERVESEGNDGVNIRNSQFCGRLRKLIKVWSSACNCKRSVF